MADRNLVKRMHRDLEHARDELGRVQAEIGSLLSKEEHLEWQIGYLSRLLSEANGTKAVHQKPATTGHPGMTAPQVIEQVLRESGKPLRVTDIVQRAIGIGYGGPNPDTRKTFANFSSLLSRAVKSPESKFKKVARGVFGLNATAAH